ncbi:MAG TPA: nicotinamide riboside transporter PnuC [Gammaproteobacteria bacterium]|nr:nicotinamide riboside transporter PnuC [Gammaproteobacteria bacterium]
MNSTSLDWSALFASMSALEVAAVAFGLLYLVLAIRQNILCWPAALIGVLLSLVLFWEARLYMEAALQLFYAAMAFYGWHQWRHGRRGNAGRMDGGLPVSVWPVRQHVIAIAATLVLSGVIGWALTRTNAAFPYLDSFTSVAAIVTTYMVAKKILENWVYWFVIDSISVYLYTARGLYLYAALFVFYLFLVVLGFVRWLRDWREQAVQAAA